MLIEYILSKLSFVVKDRCNSEQPNEQNPSSLVVSSSNGQRAQKCEVVATLHTACTRIEFEGASWLLEVRIVWSDDDGSRETFPGQLRP